MRTEMFADKKTNSDFLEGSFELASQYIKERLQRLPSDQRSRVRRLALRVMKDFELKKKGRLRTGAVRVIVALLPETFDVLESLLRDCSSPLWYEVHFTIFCALDRGNLALSDQARILQLIREYVLRINSDAGFAAWKAGDLLGDEWRDSETVEILGELLISARHVPGRKAALHGIEHALSHATKPEAEKLSALVRKAAQRDRSIEVRRNANLALKGAGCGPPIESTRVVSKKSSATRQQRALRER